MVVTFFLVGQKITPLLRLWSTMTRRESKLEEIGRSVMRSQESWWKGREEEEGIGVNRGVEGVYSPYFADKQNSQRHRHEQMRLNLATKTQQQQVGMF